MFTARGIYAVLCVVKQQMTSPLAFCDLKQHKRRAPRERESVNFVRRASIINFIGRS
jgi:hypothetical protein